MQPAEMLSGWATAIFMLPLFALLCFWMFGLDERIAAPRGRAGAGRFSQTDRDQYQSMTDPDGRPWRRS